MNRNERVQAARNKLAEAVQDLADATWLGQSEIDGEPNEQSIVGDFVVVAHFTPMDRMARDNFGFVLPSAQYMLLSSRDLPPHAIHGLMIKGGDLAQEEEDNVLDLMYPEDVDPDEHL